MPIASQQDKRRPPMRTRLLNGLTLVTVMTILIAMLYLISYNRNGIGLRDVTWYTPFKPCDPTQAVCTTSLGYDNPVSSQLLQSGSGQLSLLVTAPKTSEQSYFELTVHRHDHVNDDTVQVILNRTSSGHRYHAESIPIACYEANTRWRLSLIQHTPGQRPVGTWYDINQHCLPIMAQR